jgi:hypothetical protein
VLCTHPSNTAPCGGSTRQRKRAAPDSPKGFKENTHTHKRHATPAPAHTTPLHSDLLHIACAPGPTHSNGFCAIWVCISPSSKFIFLRVFVQRGSKARLCPLKATWAIQRRGLGGLDGGTGGVVGELAMALAATPKSWVFVLLYSALLRPLSVFFAARATAASPRLGAATAPSTSPRARHLSGRSRGCK